MSLLKLPLLFILAIFTNSIIHLYS